MNKFKELDKRENTLVESDFINYWENIDVLNKSIEKGKDNFVFYDGPAYANGFPGLHHMMAKFLKDTFCKYQTMKGKKVLRKIGWDCHGLPIELKVESALGFKNKKEIEEFGIENFNNKCKESVLENEKAFVDLTKKMGQFIDTKNPYLTYKDYYIETEWWILKRFFDEGLFYQGNKILPYCPRCGTGLASHEVAQGYKEVSVDTVIVTMKKKDEDVYFLVWTTTPWTLISNVAICVNPKEDYVLVESQGNKFIVGASLANTLFEEYNVLEHYEGTDLEHMEYEQLIPSLKVDKKAFYVTVDEYVTMTDGTGIVHIAPSFGEDDNKVARKYDLPYLNPVGNDGKYTDGFWKGMLVFDADLEVIKYLKENNKLFKKQKVVHNYPHCWRCDSPLIYYSTPSYYLEVTKIKDKIIAANKEVNWYPDYVGEKRFANWLDNLNDWAISRNRYWGVPLPLWKCSCGHSEMLGSKEELKEKASNKFDDIELHRPYVDEVKISCSKCGGVMERTPEVIDVWFDSGSMPFSQYHYPFENKELFESQFPADFICEGIDQTRGWFYTLMVISVFLTGKSPFKNVLVNDLLLDKEGKKMSKSRGNIVEPFTTMKEYGADTIRWYLPYISPVWTPIKFDMEGLKEVYSKFISTLKNTYSFFALYANTDNVDPSEYKVEYSDLLEIDKWLLSKYNKVLKKSEEFYQKYDLNGVVRLITEFVSEDLSNWYIRRNRRRFWSSQLDTSKKAVYQTTYEVLVSLSKLIAPIVPFVSEEIYQNLTNETSVHLATFPDYDDNLINDKIEEKMDLVRELIRLGRNVREESKIKVRQPIKSVIIDGSKENVILDLTDLIKEELNVKEVIYTKNINEYMNFSVKPNFKEVGKVFGPKIKMFGEKLLELTEEEINILRNEEIIKLTLDNEEYEINSTMVDIRISSKEGFNVAMYNNNFIIVDLELTDDLIKEGIARELVSKIQNIRKTSDYEITDRIKVYYNGDDLIKESINKFIEFIKEETLANEITILDDLVDNYDINGHETFIKVERI